MVNLREFSKREDILVSGHRLCPGCAIPIVARLVTLASDKPLVIGNATGCLEVSTTIFPYTSWKCSWIHNAFENVAATMSGVEAAHKVLKKRGAVKEDFNFLAFAGDGGTYDIGLQSLSGMLERGHRIVYVCVDNEAYMNTGVQRSGSTPFGANTNTAPVGKIHKGKEQFKKDLAAIVAGHHIPYLAQAAPSNWNDLIMKAQKAFAANGPAFINTLCPCVPGWGYNSEQSLKIAQLAVDTCFWPLFEVENDVWKLNYDPGANKKPLIEWFKTQSRFRHMLQPENQELVKKAQENVDRLWDWLKKECNAP